MKVTKEYLQQIIKEETQAIVAEAVAEYIPGTSAYKTKKAVEKSAEGNFPQKPPKKVKITASSGLSPEDIMNTWNQLARLPGVPKDPEKILADLGGPKALVRNVKALEANFAGSAANPPRIDMPVVDPKKDMTDLKKRLAMGALDLKEPFAPLQEVKYDMPDKFPVGLDKVNNKEQEKFLTKGLRDKDPEDDKGVSLNQVPIDVSKSYPTQDTVYLDKSIWNIMKFGATKVGGVAHGKPNLIAIQSPDGKNFILDGHHRWSSAWIAGGPSAKIRVQALTGLDIPTAVAALRAYGNARDNVQKA